MAAFFNSGTYRCKWRLAFGNGFKSGPNHIILKTSENNWLSPICTTFGSRDVIRMREYPSFLRDIFPTSPLISLIFVTSQESKIAQIGLRQLIVLFRSGNWALFLRLFWCQASSHYNYYCLAWHAQQEAFLTSLVLMTIKMTSYWPTIGQLKCMLACHR